MREAERPSISLTTESLVAEVQKLCTHLSSPRVIEGRPDWSVRAIDCRVFLFAGKISELKVSLPQLASVVQPEAGR